MKIRLTILTENNKPRPADLTEEQVIKAWELVLSVLNLFPDNEDKFVVESAEFIEEGKE